MFHRGWQEAMATVIDVRVSDTVLHVSGYFDRVFILEVHPQDGSPAFRTEVQQRIPATVHDPNNGDEIAVNYDPKSHKARIDIGALADWTKQRRHARKSRWDEELAAEPAKKPAHQSSDDDPTAPYEPGIDVDAEMAKLDQLDKLADLHSRGALSDEEFAAEKAKLLGD